MTVGASAITADESVLLRVIAIHFLGKLAPSRALGASSRTPPAPSKNVIGDGQHGDRLIASSVLMQSQS